MPAKLTVDQLIEAARELPEADRQRLALALRKQARTGKYHITELRGLGKEVWKGIDAQEYVDRERDSWER